MDGYRDQRNDWIFWSLIDLTDFERKSERWSLQSSTHLSSWVFSLRCQRQAKREVTLLRSERMDFLSKGEPTSRALLVAKSLSLVLFPEGTISIKKTHQAVSRRVRKAKLVGVVGKGPLSISRSLPQSLHWTIENMNNLHVLKQWTMGLFFFPFPLDRARRYSP